MVQIATMLRKFSLFFHPVEIDLSFSPFSLRLENETYQIVCGAPNVHADMRVVVALPGAVMPDGQVIWPGELRGVASYGMLCSAYELGADPEHQKKGILEIRADVETGTPFADISSDEML